MIALFLAALSVDPAASSVTVYGDRARVVRTADIPLSGSAQLDLPLLPAKVDPDSIRLEAFGATVRQVEIQRVERSDFPASEAHALLEQLEKLDDQAALVAGELAELAGHLAGIRGIEPAADDEPLKPRPRLNAKRWDELLAFSLAQEQAAQERVRKLKGRADELQRERQPLAEKARKLDDRATTGYRVTAALEGRGTVHLKLSYLIVGAGWTPGYDLQLQPDQKSVKVSFSGTVAQNSGEDWDGVRLTLSTAIPATVRALPELATWKIGERDRFIPTPVRKNQQQRVLPFSPPAQVRADDSWLRQELSELASHSIGDDADEEEESLPRGRDLTSPAPVTVINRSQTVTSGIASIGDSLQQVPASDANSQRAGEDIVVTGSRVRRKQVVGEEPEPERETQQVGIAPPPSWQPPGQAPDSPAQLAGGFDLVFDALRRESVLNAQGERRVLLFTETWPVTTERLIEPALSPDAYLVAQLKNPSARTLPRAQAALSVGNDPAGTATVPLAAPGQELTLPLGIDRAVRTFRNVALVQTEKGLFNKDDVSRYAVTIEVQNPYAVPVALRIVDQLPLAGDKNVEIELIEAKGAERDEGKGLLTFRTSAPAAGSVKVGFIYQLKRPKGALVHQ